MGLFGKSALRAQLVSLWLAFIIFPLTAIKVNVAKESISVDIERLAFIYIGISILATLWIYLLELRRVRETGSDGSAEKLPGARGRAFKEYVNAKVDAVRTVMRTPKTRGTSLIVLAVAVIAYPLLVSTYHIGIMTAALTYAIMALGLNIIIGFGGMLHLGYIAFFAAGAYSYALLNTLFGINFWIALPIGGIVALIFSLLLGIPVLRLRGDYLAIVTLAFGEITRIVLQNWTKLTNGPRGISGIERPQLFGFVQDLNSAAVLIYFLLIAILLLVIGVMRRLEYSRFGRKWEAMREDEVAARSMGINITTAKLSAFSVGSIWAGVAGVTFAARVTFINPPSFSIWESIVVLCAVVLGGMGSIIGVTIGALVLLLLPEYLRAFSDFRLLAFGLILVIMMIFRPGGIIQKRRHHFEISKEEM